MRVDKPWGYYDTVIVNPGHVVKYIYVNPGESLSLQKHNLRDEFWLIVSGVATVQLGKVITEMTVGQTVHILKKHKHRLSNNGTEPVVILEVQYGTCDESDIERLEDKYDRR